MARRKSYNTAEMSFDEVAESLKHNDVIMIPMGQNLLDKQDPSSYTPTVKK
ncbi:MAG: hypothetical protein KJ814_02515 [Proteobacteria bacterium]|nr:hypothetical protein [Pseudomonadota bacterium]